MKLITVTDKGIMTLYPNVTNALRINLDSVVTNCSAEHSFPKLKLEIASEHP